MPPAIASILETPVYVDDLDVAYDFYHGLMGLRRMVAGDRINAYDVAPGQVLIVCRRGGCDTDAMVNGNVVPGHRMDGVGHFAFRIDHTTLDAWLAHLQTNKINIESRVSWPLGGTSLYFRDPFSNVVELATAGVWPNDPA